MMTYSLAISNPYVILMQNLAKQLQLVRDRIHRAEAEYNRFPGSVQLLAVSKQQSVDTIAQAYALGQDCFGESYLQEAIKKIDALQHLSISWHFIGHIQSNKTRVVAEKFDWVHSVDRLKTAIRLNDQRPKNFKPLNICIQVKLDEEISKTGMLPEAAIELAQAVTKLPQLQLRGLMAIPLLRAETNAQRASFARLSKLQQQMNQQGFDMDTLSMGMSRDLEAAIAQGATIVRVGQAIFGPRE